MKQVYIEFKEGYTLCNKDYEEDNIIYNLENNIVAISNVKEVIYNGEAVKIYYKGNEMRAFYFKAIEKLTIN